MNPQLAFEFAYNYMERLKLKYVSFEGGFSIIVLKRGFYLKVAFNDSPFNKLRLLFEGSLYWRVASI